MRPLSEIVPSANGSPTLSMPALSSVALNSCVCQLGERVLDGGLALGGVELLARRRGEDEVQDAALFGGELRLDQVGPLLRVGAGDLELVAQASAEEDTTGREERDEGDGADEHHAPGLRWRTYAPTGRGARGEPLAGGGPLVSAFDSYRWFSLMPARSGSQLLQTHRSTGVLPFDGSVIRT